MLEHVNKAHTPSPRLGEGELHYFMPALCIQSFQVTEIVREDPFVASEMAEQVKTISTKPNDLSSMPRIHLLEEENRTPLAVL